MMGRGETATVRRIVKAFLAGAEREFHPPEPKRRPLP
jgi:hypothetical protein